MTIRSAILDRDGCDEAVGFDALAETAAERDGVAWIDLVSPTDDELRRVAAELDLHHLLVEDIAKRGQRTKVEPYGDVRYVVVHRLVGDAEPQVAEVHLALAPAAVVTVTWGEDGWIDPIRERVRADAASVEVSPAAIAYAVLDAVGDELVERAAALERTVERIEDAMLGPEPPAAQDSYRALRDVIAVQRVAAPLGDVLGRLAADVDESRHELRKHLRDVDDHVRRTASRMDAQRSLLQGMLELSAARVAELQNERMERMTEQSLEQTVQTKRVTSWAAILFAPTLVAGIYGMNFRHMPELDWPFGYPLALLVMGAFSGGLYLAFKRRHWL